MPWHSDVGPSGTARNWTEHHRVIPEQGAEWLALLAAHPGARLVVAGDLNTTIDAPGYGTRRGRELLAAALQAADLACPTAGPSPTVHLGSAHRVERAFIDHVCVSRSIAHGAAVVAAWEGTQDGVRLSDHPAVVIDVPALRPTTAGPTATTAATSAVPETTTTSPRAPA